MKQWPWMMFVLYLLVVGILISAVYVLSFFPTQKYLSQAPMETALSIFTFPHFWVLWVVLLIAEVMLLAVPVSLVGQRPVKRRTLLLPVIAAGLLAAGLFAGLVLVIAEAIIRSVVSNGLLLLSLAVLLLMWLLWGYCFYRLSKRSEPKAFIERLCRYLVRGSILELLVAVPTHVFVRSRDYCCAGFGTFIGIVFGLSVMLVSFGPGVYFLYAARFRQKCHNPSVKP